MLFCSTFVSSSSKRADSKFLRIGGSLRLWKFEIKLIEVLIFPANDLYFGLESSRPRS